MSLTKEAVRKKARTVLADIAGSVSDPDLNIELDRVYNHEIPDLVPGTAREGKIDLTFTAGTEQYELDTHADLRDQVLSIRKGARTDAVNRLRYFTDRDQFYGVYDQFDTGQGNPDGYLYFGRSLFFRPVPSAATVVTLPASLYRTTGLPDPIYYDPEGLACAYGAAFTIAAERGEHEIASDASSLYLSRIDELKGRSLTRVSERPMARSW